MIRMKIAPLGLAGGRSYDRTNSLRTPTMKESQLLREKNHFLGLSFNMFKRCGMPSFIDLHTHATPGHVTSFVCSRNTSDIDRLRMIAPPAKIYARDRSRSRWNMKHFRQTANRTRLLAAPVLPVLAVDLLTCTRRRHCSLTRDSHQPVMTGSLVVVHCDRSWPVDDRHESENNACAYCMPVDLLPVLAVDLLVQQATACGLPEVFHVSPRSRA